jgi:hypothetical protein
MSNFSFPDVIFIVKENLVYYMTYMIDINTLYINKHVAYYVHVQLILEKIGHTC